MGTTRTDTMYTAFAPPDVDPRVALHRWSRIRPWVLAAVRRTDCPALDAEMSRLERVHAERLARLVRAGVTAKQLNAGKLDDPLESEAAFAGNLAAAVERHRDRLGRVKGRGPWSKVNRGKRNDHHA
jgi:hypothetical protein